MTLIQIQHNGLRDICFNENPLTSEESELCENLKMNLPLQEETIQIGRAHV